MRAPVLVSALVLLAGCFGSGGDEGDDDAGNDPPVVVPGELRLEPVAVGLAEPLLLTHAGDGSGRLFVVEKPGRIVILGSNATFIDVGDRVDEGSTEQGLLGMAFHPDFAANGVVILSYTGLEDSGDGAADTVVSRFTLADDDTLDPASEEVLLRVNQPFANHNGGHVVYGPDGYLYFGLGDGGLAGDPNLNGQNKRSLLGDLLRIDVGPTGPYTIPPDNPYAGSSAEGREIWASGLRNPWRFSFDRDTGDLWIADVGQDMFEEVNLQPAGQGGRNYGWNVYEGNHHYPVDATAPLVTGSAGFTFPVNEYSHAVGGCSVTGGFVYRGTAVPALEGAYIFGDYCTGLIWRLDDTGSGWERTQILESGLNISSFGEDEQGELYVVDLQGTIHKFVA